MSFFDLNSDLEAIEQCADDLMRATDPIADRYTRNVFAAALGAHLACLLRALREEGACTSANVRVFYRRFECEAITSDGVH